MKVALILSLMLLSAVIAHGQDQSRKYYCPPCSCMHDTKLFDKPGICPDPSCNMELLPVEGDYIESKLRFLSIFIRTGWLMRLYDVLILPAIIQGLILSLILIFRGYANKLASFFLAMLVIALSLQNVKFYYILNVLMSYVGGTGGNPEYNIESLSFPLSGLLFLGPAVYFYVLSLTQAEFKFHRKHVVHFLPGLVFILINSVFFFGLANDAAHAAMVRLFTTLSLAENLLAIGLAFYYTVLSVKLMRRHELWIFEHFSTTTRKSLRWLRNLVIALSAVWFIWLFAVVINFFTGDFLLTYLSSYPFQVATSIIIFWIGYVGFIQNEVFSAELSFERKIDDLKSASKKDTASQSQVKEILLSAMEQKKLFLVPELSLAMLGQELNLSPKSISQTLNHELNKNFHDFVNEYRVEEVKKRLLDPSYRHLTILAIALDSGFNSKASFNRIFMKVTGLSPKAFKDQHATISDF